MPSAAAWAALAALAVVPLLRDQWPLFDSLTGAKALVGLFEAAFAVAVFSTSRLQPGDRALRVAAWALALLAVWATVTVLASGHPVTAAVRHAEWLLHAAFAAAVAAWWQRSAEHRTGMVALFVAGLVLYFVEFAIFRATQPADANWSTILPGFSNVRHLGHHATAGLPLALLLVLRAPARWATTLGIAGLVVAWFFLFWTGGRGPLVALAGGIVLLWLSASRPALGRRHVWLPAAAVPAGLLAWLMAVERFGVWRLWQTMVGADSLNALTSGRLAIWQRVIDQVVDAPLTGVGPDGLLFVALSHAPIAHAHNSVLQAAAEWGLPGAALASTIAAIVGLRALTRRTDPAALWGLAALAALSFVSGVAYVAQSSMLAALLLGVVAAEAGAIVSVPRVSRGALALVAAGVIVLALHAASLHDLRRVVRADAGTTMPGIWMHFPSAAARVDAGQPIVHALVGCLDAGAADCAGFARAAAGYSRRPYDEVFGDALVLIESGQRPLARQRLLRITLDRRPRR